MCYGLSLEEGLYPVLVRSGRIFLLAEASTACINFRWFAARAGHVQRAKQFEWLFLASFVGTRIIVGIPMSVSWWRHDLPRIHVPVVACFYVASNVAWNAMNIFTAFRWRRRRGALKYPDAARAVTNVLGRESMETGDSTDAEALRSQNDASASLSSHEPEPQTRLLSIKLSPYPTPCMDDDLACQLTVSSALDCQMDLWFFPAAAPKAQKGVGSQDGVLQAPPPDASHAGAAMNAHARQHATMKESEMAAKSIRAIDRKFVTRIHGKWYNLTGFKHPGGPVALSLVGGRDGTALFESHHPFTSRAKLEQVLGKYLVQDQEEEGTAEALLGLIDKRDDGGHYEWHKNDAFERELKDRVLEYFRGEAARRGVSLIEATKATPRRWAEIGLLLLLFVSTVPAFVRGEAWTLLVTPVLSWVWMVNYWHDACHFALSTKWWINAALPYFGPWFSSPTTWYHQHVIGHHAYPNVAHKDPDLAHAPQLLREHESIRWRKLHKTQHHMWRVGFVWSIAVGLGLHLAVSEHVQCCVLCRRQCCHAS